MKQADAIKICRDDIHIFITVKTLFNSVDNYNIFDIDDTTDFCTYHYPNIFTVYDEYIRVKFIDSSVDYSDDDVRAFSESITKQLEEDVLKHSARYLLDKIARIVKEVQLEYMD